MSLNLAKENGKRKNKVAKLQANECYIIATLPKDAPNGCRDAVLPDPIMKNFWSKVNHLSKLLEKPTRIFFKSFKLSSCNYLEKRDRKRPIYAVYSSK